jgi:hypothetical protein
MRIALPCSTVLCLLAVIGCADDPVTSPPDNKADPALSAALTTVTGYLLAAGDIASCSGSGDESTAALLDRYSGLVLALGDNAYDRGTTAEYNGCYDPSWGRHRSRTRPTPGNHDYKTSNAAPYYTYFGSRAGPAGRGYYSFNYGGWHIVALNSNIDVSSTSPQVQWLKADLAANPVKCTLAFWHHPRFSSGKHGNLTRLVDIWNVLYHANADVVLNGHDHDYERFGPQTPSGVEYYPRGIRELVVGTGGASPRSFETIKPHSYFRYSGGRGILRLTLTPTSFTWQFITTANRVIDQGTRYCH